MHASHGWYESDEAAKVTALTALLDRAGLRPRSVLDVGCGTGGVLDGVCRHLEVEDAVGIDPDNVAIARARDRWSRRFELGDVATTELWAELVLCVDVFEHVDDDVDFLRRVAAHGQWFLFRIPLDDAMWDRARGRTEAFRDLYGHLHAYTRRQALRRLRTAGLDVQQEAYHRIPVGRVLSDGVRDVAGRVAPHLAARVLGGWSLVVLARGRSRPDHAQAGVAQARL